ncbi:hypothetical protein KEM55_006847, partial [Ascosphaera atra]
IFTLLQPPIVRTGLLPHAQTPAHYKAPSSRDIPPVTLTNIPKVDSSVFQTYLSQVSSSYDAIRRAKAAAEEHEFLAAQKQAPLKPSSSDLQLNSIIEEGSPTRSGQSTTGTTVSASRARGQGTAPLSTVPSVYFESDFHLENPRTFDVVSERSEVTRTPRSGEKAKEKSNDAFPGTGRKALATNAILQEKLSWYLDIVEIHLISSISNASTSFFSALASLQALHKEATASVEKMQALRGDLSKLDQGMALGGLQVVNLKRRRENVRKLADAVAQLQEVIVSVSNCEKLVEERDYQKALDELDDVERLLAGEEPNRGREGLRSGSEEQVKMVDLRRLDVLDGASNDLDELRHRIGVGYERMFVDSLLGDLQKHVEAMPVEATLLRLGESLKTSRRGHRPLSTGELAYTKVDDEMREKLRFQITGLNRVRYIASASKAFRSAVLRELKSLVRRHLPSSSDDDNLSTMSGATQGGRQLSQQQKSSILARNLRNLDPEDAYTMLAGMYSGLTESLRRLGTQIKVLLDIASGLEEPLVSSRSTSKSRTNDDVRSRSASPAQYQKDQLMDILDMSTLLNQAIESTQGQIVKVLKVRSEQTVKLSLVDFVRYFSLNKLFVHECEAISGSGSAAINSVVDAQIKEFTSNLSDNQMRRLIQVMDADRWDAKDFGEKDSQMLSRILEASHRDPEAWTATSRIWEKPEDVDESPESSQSDKTSTTSGKEKVRSAVVDDQSYILPECALSLLRVMEDFLHLMTEMPTVIPDIAARLLDCLKLFNSRSSQLILGAGATRSAGLRNITTKHLAIASQALSFITALIPYVREFVRRHSATSSLMGEFDKVKRLYQEHQTGINEKLIEIMSSRAAVHVKAMRNVDWEAAEDTKAISPYMETLTKETGTLYRVLSKHLPESTVSLIMGPVFENYKTQWTEAFQSATLRSEHARQRMLSDVELFRSRIDKIGGSNGLGDHLKSIVNAKPIVSPPRSPAPEKKSSESAEPSKIEDKSSG